MKFIYTGQLPIKDVDLTLAGIFKPEEEIIKGTVFDVPDDNKKLIRRVKVAGIYEPFIEPKKPLNSKKKQKNEEEVKKEEK